MKIIFGLLFISNFVFAGFYSPENLPEDSSLQGISNLQTSHHRVWVGGQRCSGFFVSEAGFFVTNLHCIDVCLFREGKIKNQGQVGLQLDINKRIGLGQSNIVCPEISIPKLELNGAKIVFVGSGFANFDDFQVQKFTPETLTNLKEIFYGDFAILKFEVSSLTKNQFSCVNVSQKASPEKEKVWLAAFPGLVYRPGDHGSDGQSFYLSPGKLGINIEQNEFFNLYAPVDPVFWLNQGLWASQFLIADVDSAFGSSGGSWVNASGEVIGLNAGIAGPNQRQNSERYYSYTSMALPMLEVQRMISDEIGLVELKKYFNCH